MLLEIKEIVSAWKKVIKRNKSYVRVRFDHKILRMGGKIY